MKIGDVEINGLAALAPMAGVTDAAFRQQAVRYGAAYAVSEMISARAMEFDDSKTAGLADISHDEGHIFLQIFGEDPDCIAKAAGKLQRLGPAGIDINMGCPMPKITGGGAGSALLKNPGRCGEIVRAVSRAVDLPVTVKIRSGWDEGHINAVEVAKICEEAGAAAVCVHARTRDQMYQGKADWDVIRQVKEAVGIPVIGNGDVVDPMSASRMISETGCDMVMIGRAALGNPWVFQAVNAHLRNESLIFPPPSLAQRIVAMRKHIGRMCEYKGEGKAMREARKHVAWYLKGMRGAAEFRRRSSELCTLEDLDSLIEDVYRSSIEAE